MAALNKVQLIGHVGKDPELKYTQSGTAVANFSIATTEKFKDKSGAQKENTEWHRIVAWARLAEVVGEYVKKGLLVYIEGKLQTRKWEKEGQTHYTTEINAFSIQFLGGKSNGARTDAPDNDDEQPNPQPQSSAADSDEDLPF